MAADQQDSGGRDWLRELAESPDPSTLPAPAPSPSSPAGSGLPLTVELSMLRREVAELRSLMQPQPKVDDAIGELRREIAALRAQLSEPRREDGAGVLTASALIELQAEVGRLHDDLPLDNNARFEALESMLEQLTQQVLAIAQGMRALAHVDYAGPIEEGVRDAIDETQQRVGEAMEHLGRELALLRSALIGS